MTEGASQCVDAAADTLLKVGKGQERVKTSPNGECFIQMGSP